MDRKVVGDVMGKALAVALRKESVDRKRGWTLNINGPMTVALRKESVDRKVGIAQGATAGDCRSPQGERG